MHCSIVSINTILAVSIMNNPVDDGAIVITSNDLDDVANSCGDDAQGGADADTDTDTAVSRLEMATLPPLPPPPTRRRSLRQTVEPDRFVARPSLQGLTNEDGDAMFLARGISVGGMATGGNHIPEGAHADEGNDEIKHHFRTKHEGHTKNERAVELDADQSIFCNSSSLSIEGSNCDEQAPLDGKRPQNPQVDISVSENTIPTESSVNHRGTELIGNQATHSAHDSSVSPALEKSDALCESMQSELSHKPKRGVRNSNNLTNDENLREDNVESKLSTPVLDHIFEQSNHSFDVDTKVRHPERKRSTNSLNDEWDSGEDEGDGGDDDNRVASVVTEGAIASTADYEGKLDFQISPFPPSPRMCKAVSCTKYAQGAKGLCCHHYTQYLVCTGQCASWTCDCCGGKNKATSRRCHKCRVKFGNSVILKEQIIPHISSLGGIVDEEKENEEVELIRATSAVAFEGSKPRSDCPNPSRSGELDSRYPKRKARNSAEEVLTSGLKINVSSTPSHRGKKTVPNSASSSNSSGYKINTLYDHLLDFSVSSPSSPTKMKGYYCRATSCNKRAQSLSNGFCRRHHNSYLICTGQCDFWTCDCGNKNIHYAKQCGICHTPRSEASPMSSKSIISPVAAAAMTKGQLCTKAEKRSRKKTGRKSGLHIEKSHQQSTSVDGRPHLKNPRHHLNDVVLHCASIPTATSTSTGGIKSLRTFVPPEYANLISQSERRIKGRKYCKIITCNKCEQSETEGFCATHFNMFSIDNAKRSSNMESIQSTSLFSSSSSSALVSFANVPELTLLERTRNELLNGRDCWICIDCAVEVPSITYPCWKCNVMISFVPLEVDEFEEFVQKQREMNMKRRSNVG